MHIEKHWCGKNVLVGEYRKLPVSTRYYSITAPIGVIERWVKDTNFKFYEAKKNDPIMADTNLFGDIINIHSFKDGNERIFRLILVNVLMQTNCCLFLVTSGQ